MNAPDCVERARVWLQLMSGSKGLPRDTGGMIYFSEDLVDSLAHELEAVTRLAMLRCASAPLDIPAEYESEHGTAAHLRTKILSMVYERLRVVPKEAGNG